MDEQTKVTAEQPVNPTPAPTPAPQHAASAVQYDSNPFTTTLTGIKKLFRLNANPLIGTVLFNILLGALTIATLLAGFVALIAFLMQSNPTLGAMAARSFPPDALEFFGSISVGSIYATWAICLVLIIFFAALGQAIQIKLVTATATGAAIHFGELLKKSTKSVLPLVGLTALATLVAIAIVLLFAALFAANAGILLFLLVPALLVLGFYFGVRLAFTSFAIVEEGVGPIASIKRSMALTKGHFAETIGVAAATMVIVFVPTIFLDLLTTVGGPAGGIFQLISLVVGLIVGTIAIVGAAERFVQLRAVKDGTMQAGKTHVSNYLAIMAVIVCMIISGMVSNRMNQTYPPMQDPYNTSDLEQQLKELNSQTEQSAPSNMLDEYGVPEEQYQPNYNLN